MSKFDTHGGYFAPKDYMKVEEGGSHEENPNGGVQVGVDPQGTPNLLEEGEPVYKDYVYSDNIEADEKFLEENNIPAKYAGKLYSKIADAFVSEAEERPLDPISRNGLEVMLGRLADAQEGQKQAEEQKKLEAELATLPPEELDQLEAMLAQGGENLGEAPGVMGPAEPVQQMPQGMMQPAPGMGCGGYMRRRYDSGGTIPPGIKEQAMEAGPLFEVQSDPNELGHALEKTLSYAPPSFLTLGAQAGIGAYNDFVDNTAVGNFLGGMFPGSATEAFSSPLMRQAERAAGPVGRALSRTAKNAWEGLKKLPGKLLEVEGRKAMLQEAKAAVQEAHAASTAARDAANAVADEVKAARVKLASDPGNKALQQTVAELEAKSAKADAAALKASAKSAGARIEAANKTVGAFTGGPMYNRKAVESEIEGLRRAYEGAKKAAEAAPKDTALKEAAEEALKELQKAETGWAKWGKHGEWWYKAPIGGAVVGTKAAGSRHDKKQNWVESQFGKGGNLFFGGGEPYTVDKDTLLDPAVVIADGPGTPYPHRNRPPQGLLLSPHPIDLSAFELGDRMEAEEAERALEEARASTMGTGYPVYGNQKLLPTWPRYSGAIGSGLLGLYNAFQQPDKYTDTKMPVFTPEGRINLQNQVYRPIDQNMVANAQIAQGNATQRALRNSGLGPSTAASILAADNNLTGNLGIGFIQAWDANNQRRNAVIAANNQAEGQRAQFDANMDYYRAAMLNNWAARRAQDNLMIQRLNNAAEGEKYAAISNQLDQGFQALSDIGKENFGMNQINTNPAFLGYRVGPDGSMYYNPYLWYGNEAERAKEKREPKKKNKEK